MVYGWDKELHAPYRAPIANTTKKEIGTVVPISDNAMPTDAIVGKWKDEEREIPGVTVESFQRRGKRTIVETMVPEKPIRKNADLWTATAEDGRVVKIAWRTDREILLSLYIDKPQRCSL